MAMITVHAFKRWDPKLGKFLTPSRKATRRRIAEIGCLLIADTNEEIDESLLNEWGFYTVA